MLFRRRFLLAAVAVATYFIVRPRHEPDVQNGQPRDARTFSSANSETNICVEATYPGAKAQTVLDLVAKPIEEQVNGVEGMSHMSSQCTNDGVYVLNVSFPRRTDTDIAQVLVQNRVSLALPSLPTFVQNHGITVKRKSPHLAMMVSLISPDGRYDGTYLSNFATIQIKDELGRLPGVAEVVTFGKRDYGMRVWLDLDKLAASDVAAADVIKALEQQNLQVAAGVGKDAGFQFEINNLGRLVEPDQLGNVIVKAGPEGKIIRVRDLARVEMASSGAESRAAVDGKPAVLLAIYPLPGTNLQLTSDAVKSKMTELGALFPEGIDYQIHCDLTGNLEDPGNSPASEYLRIDLLLPDGASKERIFGALEHCSNILQQVPEVRHVLVMTENPFELPRNDPSVLAVLKTENRGQVAQRIRARLQEELKQAAIRLCNPSGIAGVPIDRYPLSLAILDRGGPPEKLQPFAEKLIDRLRQSGKLTDVGFGASRRNSLQLSIEIDREKAAAAGVSVQEIQRTLSTLAGETYANDFNLFGRNWPLTIQVGAELAKLEDKMKEAKVRGDQGQLLPLSQFGTVGQKLAPTVIDRLDMYPSIMITANPEAGTSLDDARQLCETLAAEVGIDKHFKLIWLGEQPK